MPFGQGGGSAVAQPGREAGTLFIPALNRTIKLVEWREDDFYDTVTFGDVSATKTPTFGTTLNLFRDLSSKNLPHTNLRTPRRIPSGSEFIMARVGVMPLQAFGNIVYNPDDIVKLAYAATLNFILNDRLITTGPLFKYQSGYGVTGGVAGVTGATPPVGSGLFKGYVTVGVPSAAAAPNLMVAQPVEDNDDLVADISIVNNAWPNSLDALTNGAVAPIFTNAPAVSLMLHGFIKKPQGK
jgi:hypothetical protein